MTSPWSQPRQYYDEDTGGLDGPPPYSDNDTSIDNDNAFNTSAIHGVNYDESLPSTRVWYRKKSVLYAAAAVALVVLIAGVSMGASGAKSNSSNSSSTANNNNQNAYNSGVTSGAGRYIPNAPPGGSYKGGTVGTGGGQPNSDNSGVMEPIVGQTKDGPKDPEMQVPAENANAHRDEFGTTLVGLYDRHNMEWTPLSQTDTPQGKALLFVTGAADYDSMPQSKKIQRYALAVFYYSTYLQAHAFWTDPTDWTSAWQWMTTTDECLWEGIVCHETSKKVTAIILPAHALSGGLPIELALLDEINEIDLSQNFLHMTPSQHDDHRVFGMLPQLQKLEMGDNYILTENTGLPSSLGKLQQLQRVSFSYNLLQGPLDGAVVANLQQLTHLEIESKYLSGTLPRQLGQLERLYYLYLRRNLLQVDLNSMLESNQDGTAATYANIFSLWLDDNQMVAGATIPTAIGGLTGLASFSVTNTTLGGSIPAEIGNCRELQRLWLYGNQLTGTVPNTIGQLEHLQVMELQNNPRLSGSMPQGACNAVAAADYEFKTLSADCSRVVCDDCCTECY